MHRREKKKELSVTVLIYINETIAPLNLQQIDISRHSPN